MRKHSDAKMVEGKPAAREVSETDLRQVRGGAGNAAIDFSVKPSPH